MKKRQISIERAPTRPKKTTGKRGTRPWLAITNKIVRISSLNMPIRKDNMYACSVRKLISTS